jgi:hypothetical protein
MQSLWRDPPVSNNVLLAVEVDGAIAPDRIRRAVDRLLDSTPWPAARLRRPFPWGKLHWVAGPRATLVPPPVRQCAVPTSEALHAELEAELNAAIDPWRHPPLRLLIAHCGSGRPRAVLVLTWFHALMDPRGGQNLLMRLADLDRDDGTDAAPAGPSAAPADARPLRERGRIARRSLHYMRSLAPLPPVSPGTGLASPGRVRFRRDSFVEREPPGDARPTREISWRLALVGKAMAGLWARRELPLHVPFLVAVAVDLRPRGELGPIFGNTLAFHFARFLPAETDDVTALARRLRRQMADAVRDGQIEANAVAMEFLHYRPLATMLKDLPGTGTGETFSFNCADVSDFPGAGASLFGRRVLDAYHAPAVFPRPGIGVFFNRCGTRNNLVVSWIDGAVTADEVAAIVEVVRLGMTWNRCAS